MSLSSEASALSGPLPASVVASLDRVGREAVLAVVGSESEWLRFREHFDGFPGVRRPDHEALVSLFLEAQGRALLGWFCEAGGHASSLLVEVGRG